MRTVRVFFLLIEFLRFFTSCPYLRLLEYMNEIEEGGKKRKENIFFLLFEVYLHNDERRLIR